MAAQPCSPSRGKTKQTGPQHVTLCETVRSAAPKLLLDSLSDSDWDQPIASMQHYCTKPTNRYTQLSSFHTLHKYMWQICSLSSAISLFYFDMQERKLFKEEIPQRFYKKEAFLSPCLQKTRGRKQAVGSQGHSWGHKVTEPASYLENPLLSSLLMTSLTLLHPAWEKTQETQATSTLLRFSLKKKKIHPHIIY